MEDSNSRRTAWLNLYNNMEIPPVLSTNDLLNKGPLAGPTKTMGKM